MINQEYDIIVIGGGHAGCEAAYCSALLGHSVLLVTMDMSKVAQMSCNPAIGGIAKGQIAREIDALGGGMGIVTDASTIQFRMLNRSKGAAMWSPRAQCDRMLYSATWREMLENTSGLDIWQDSVASFLFDGSKITGICTALGVIFKSQAVILTSGTFLNGRLFVGDKDIDGGRIGELSSYGLTEQLNKVGIKSGRMKTGTPPRIDIRYVDLSKLETQYGDPVPERFSYLPRLSPIQKGKKQKPCYIVHTNLDVHNILRSGFHLSPLFSGKITGIGPRYCPSIEDKLLTFKDKNEHQLFLEPEGWSTNEYYLQGFSSSLPYETQISALRNVKGFEHLKVYRPAYAVEYDYFPPEQLNHTLESKIIENLYFAGQVNGTTGYEEAAAQGMMAGINASNKLKGKEPFILKRDEAYIGVLIDDLVTKGVDEPYRMFTSRAEYRILLRQDDADQRLTQKSLSLGLATKERGDFTALKYQIIDDLIRQLEKTKISPEEINPLLDQKNTSLVQQPKTLTEILTRPQINIKDLQNIVPRGTFEIENGEEGLRERFKRGIEEGLYEDFNKTILEATEIRVKYKGYIEREKRAAEKIKRLENIKIPQGFDFEKISSLSTESRQKLNRVKPDTIGDALRIPGVSPADISVLLVFFGR